MPGLWQDPDLELLHSSLPICLIRCRHNQHGHLASMISSNPQVFRIFSILRVSLQWSKIVTLFVPRENCLGFSARVSPLWFRIVDKGLGAKLTIQKRISMSSMIYWVRQWVWRVESHIKDCTSTIPGRARKGWEPNYCSWESICRCFSTDNAPSSTPRAAGTYANLTIISVI